jgi:hypothetical protein
VFRTFYWSPEKTLKGLQFKSFCPTWACTTPAVVALLAVLLNYLLLLTRQSAEHGAVETQWKELFSFRDHQSQPVHHPNWTASETRFSSIVNINIISWYLITIQ